MPTYEYRCKDCGHEFEVVQSFTDDALTECPACGGAAAQGVRQRRHHVQGQRLLQDRQPLGVDQRHVDGEEADGDSSKKRRRRPTSSDRRLVELVEAGVRARRPRRATVVLRAERRHRPRSGRRTDRSASSAVPGSTGCSTTSPRSRVDTPVGPPSGPVAGRPARRPEGGLPPPPRAAPRAPAPPGQLPGQRLGACTSSASPASSARAPSGRCGPTSRPAHFVVCDQLVDRTLGPARHLFDGPRRQPRGLRRPVLPRAAGGRRSPRAEAEGVAVHDGGTSSSSRGPASRPGPSAAGTAPQGWDVIEHDPVPRGRTSPASWASATPPSRSSPTTTPASRTTVGGR